MDPLEVVLDPRGKIGRMPFLLAYVGLTLLKSLVGMVLVVTIAGVSVISAFAGSEDPSPGAGSAVVLIMVALAFVYAFVVIVSKRLRDIGMSAWHCLWVFAILFMVRIQPMLGASDLGFAFGHSWIFAWAVVLWLSCVRGAGAAVQPSA